MLIINLIIFFKNSRKAKSYRCHRTVSKKWEIEFINENEEVFYKLEYKEENNILHYIIQKEIERLKKRINERS